MDPFPSAASVLKRFAESSIDRPLKRKCFLSLLDACGITSHAEKTRRRMMALAERGVNPFDIETVPANFSGIYPEFSVSILFERTDDPPAQRATKLVLATLEYRRLLTNGLLEKESRGEMPVDTDRRHNFFGRVANIRKSGLKWSKQIKDCKDSSHIVVAVDGSYYRLDVLDGGGAVIAADRILHNINSMIDAAAREQARKPYGLITTNIARPADEIFYAAALDELIRAIDDAIFLLAIDTVDPPADENEAGRSLHIRSHNNRDYRKSLQVVVLPNGFSGATINYFAEIEGAFAARFASWIGLHAAGAAQIAAGQNQDSFSRLEFKTIDFDRLPLARLRDKIAVYSCDLPLIKRIDVIGRDAIKKLNVSPDAFFHAAAHLAYYQAFKKIPAVHNFVDMRGVKFGSITRYLSTTAEMVRFLENQTKPALLDAAAAHSRTLAVIRSGDYPLHYAYYYLYTTIGLKPVLALALFKLFVPDIFTKHIAPDIGASSIPALPGIHCMGRFGLFFKAARHGCRAGHYLLFPDHIKVCFPSTDRASLESWQFDQALERALRTLEQMLS